MFSYSEEITITLHKSAQYCDSLRYVGKHFKRNYNRDLGASLFFKLACKKVCKDFYLFDKLKNSEEHVRVVKLDEKNTKRKHESERIRNEKEHKTNRTQGVYLQARLQDSWPWKKHTRFALGDRRVNEAKRSFSHRFEAKSWFARQESCRFSHLSRATNVYHFA